MVRSKQVSTPDSKRILGKGVHCDVSAVRAIRNNYCDSPSESLDEGLPDSQPSFELFRPSPKSLAQKRRMRTEEGISGCSKNSTMLVPNNSNELARDNDFVLTPKTHKEGRNADEKRKAKVVEDLVEDVHSHSVKHQKRRKVDCTKEILSVLKPWDFCFKQEEHCKLKVDVVIKDINVSSSLGDYLNPRQLNMFKQTCFGYFMDLSPATVQPRLIHSLLLREVFQTNQHELWISLNGIRLRFGIGEFALITGLKCSGDAHKRYDIKKSCTLVDRCFLGISKLTCKSIYECFEGKKWTSDEDAVKMAILYFINKILFSNIPEKNVSIGWFELVETGEYQHYPWGKLVFDETIKSLSKQLRGKKTKGYSKLTGFPLAFQVWFYECCKQANNQFALFQSEKVPRLLSWKVISNPTSIESAKILSDRKLKLRNIFPTVLEKSRLDVKHFFDDDTVNYAVEAEERNIRSSDDDFTSPPHLPTSPNRNERCNTPQKDIDWRAEIKCILTEQKELKEEFSMIKKDLDRVHVLMMDTNSKIQLLNDLMVESNSNIFSAIDSLSKKFEGNKDEGVQRNQHVDGVASESPDPYADWCVDVPESQIHKYTCPEARQKVAEQLAQEKSSTFDIQSRKIVDLGNDTSAVESSSRKDIYSELVPIYNLADDDEIVTEQLIPKKPPSDGLQTHIMELGVGASAAEQLLEKNIVDGLHHFDSLKNDDDISTKYLARNKRPAIAIQSPYIVNFGSGASAAGGSSTKNIVKVLHPFDSSINYVDYEKIVCDFKGWMEQGLRKNAKVNHYSKTDNAITPTFKFGDIHVGKKELFLKLAYKDHPISDSHLDVIFYYLRKKGKCDSDVHLKFTTTDTLFHLKIKALYKKFIESNRDIQVLKPEHDIAKYILGNFILCNTPWHAVDEILFPITVEEQWHWILVRLSFKDRCLYVYDSRRGSSHRKKVREVVVAYAVVIPHFLALLDFFGKRNDINFNIGPYKDKRVVDPFRITTMENLPLQKNVDCGVLAAFFAEQFICATKMLPMEFVDLNAHRTRLGALLYHYGKLKRDQNVPSDSEAPNRLTNSGRVPRMI